MTSFESGFLIEALECGLSPQKAAYMLKRAADHEEFQQLFKSLPSSEEPNQEEEEENPYDLASLSEMLQQELINRHMSAAQHKITL